MYFDFTNLLWKVQQCCYDKVLYNYNILINVNNVNLFVDEDL